MNDKKYKILFLLILYSYLFPIGGIGLSGHTSINPVDMIEQEGNLTLNLDSPGPNNGLGLFLYFDALPKDLALEYEWKFYSMQSADVNMLLNIDGNQNQTHQESLSMFTKSQYFTIRKEIIGVSIPFLAKAGLNFGLGYNEHNSLIPSIALLKELVDNPNININDLFDSIKEEGVSNIKWSDMESFLTESSGIHLQAGIQGKIMTMNLFLNARYTIIINNESEINQKGFPSINLGLALGI